MGEVILRQIFSNFESQTLINELHNVRGRVGFNGLAIFLILKNKYLIKEDLYKRIKDFKDDRNMISHNIEAEYKLLPPSELKNLNNQSEYDLKVQARADESLHDAHNIWNELLVILSDISEKKVSSVEVG